MKFLLNYLWVSLLTLPAFAATQPVLAPQNLSELSRLGDSDRYSFRYQVSGGCKAHSPQYELVVDEIIQKEKILIEGKLARKSSQQEASDQGPDRPVHTQIIGSEIVARLKIQDTTEDGEIDPCRSVVNVDGEIDLKNLYQEALAGIQKEQVGLVRNFRLKVQDQTLNYPVQPAVQSQ